MRVAVVRPLRSICPGVLIAIVLVLRVAGPGARADAGRISLLPWFMLLFLALVTLGSVVVANAL